MPDHETLRQIGCACAGFLIAWIICEVIDRMRWRP